MLDFSLDSHSKTAICEPELSASGHTRLSRTVKRWPEFKALSVFSVNDDGVVEKFSASTSDQVFVC